MRIPDPEGTRHNCNNGCGLMTVTAVTGDGRPVRVHCGTYLPKCPSRNDMRTAIRAAEAQVAKVHKGGEAA